MEAEEIIVDAPNRFVKHAPQENDMTTTALAIHEKITEYAKSASQGVRYWAEPFKMVKIKGKMHPQWARQGDVMLVHIAKLPASAVAVTTGKEYQLAPGTSDGSRHCLQMRAGVTVYKTMDTNPLLGGFIVATERCYISHPSHAHMDLPSGIYEIRQQQDLSADEIRAVRD